VRFAGGAHDDQARVGTPERIARAGGNLLVIGRAVTGADDRRAAAQRATDALVSALEGD
jgi:orotidine-5'-phosphate decarboxylase